MANGSRFGQGVKTHSACRFIQIEIPPNNQGMGSSATRYTQADRCNITSIQLLLDLFWVVKADVQKFMWLAQDDMVEVFQELAHEALVESAADSFEAAAGMGSTKGMPQDGAVHQLAINCASTRQKPSLWLQEPFACVHRSLQIPLTKKFSINSLANYEVKGLKLQRTAVSLVQPHLCLRSVSVAL